MPQLSGPQLKAAIGVAAFVLLVYVGGLIWLTTQRGEQDPTWTRSVFIVNGIEALAFAAAGWLWGTQVNRGAAEVAQQQAKETKEELKQTKADADEQSERLVQAERQAAETAQKERSRAGFLAMEQFIADGAEGRADNPDSGSVSSAGAPTAVSAEQLKQFLRKLNPGAFLEE